MKTAMPLLDRFFAKVRVGATPEDCWRWTGAIDLETGYGRIGVGGRGAGIASAHRLSFEMHDGFLPDGHEVCHMCNHRWCVNPLHLYAGTRKDNVRDAIRAGTFSPPPRFQGENHPQAKLTAALVAEIREQLTGAPGELTSLARKYGVTRTTIGRIRSGRNWQA